MEGWSVSKTGTIYKKKNWIGKATDHASWMKLWKMYVKSLLLFRKTINPLTNQACGVIERGDDTCMSHQRKESATQ